MAVKFRNSLLGFNKDDVLKYVYSTKETLNKNEQTINEKNKLNKELSDESVKIKAELANAYEKIEELQAKVDDFEQREATLTKLSENIGKLYLVAKTNAKTIVSAAEENVRLSKIAVDKNIETAEITSENLTSIESELLSTAKRFSDEIEAIKLRLKNTKQNISENEKTISNGESVMDNLIEKVDAVTTV